MKALEIGNRSLELEEIADVALRGRKVRLSKVAEKKIKASRKYLLDQIKQEKIFYGVNTGFGHLASVRISDQELETLQYNLLRSHACGVGHYMPDHYVAAMLLLRAHNLAMGFSGVSVGLVKQLLSLINAEIYPLVPQQGSVGASGDLAPLAHLALVLIGEGKARYNGKDVSGAKALAAAGLKPIRLGAKEGLALINGTQFMTAIGALTLLESEHLARVADVSGGMTLEALRGSTQPFDPWIHNLRPHPGQITVAKHMRKILMSKGKSEIAQSHADCDRVQDPYSLRCIPQVHGASRDSMAYVRSVLEREINSVTDNPLIIVPGAKNPKTAVPSSSLAPAGSGGKILSGGNFHGQIVAIALDLLAIAVAELANISEQRIEKLTNPALSGLPAFLTRFEGLNSGLMIVQVAAASIVSENKTLCHPASVDSIPTSADKEDHVSMGAWAARKAARVLNNSRKVLAMELLANTQGVDLLRPLKTTPFLEKVHAELRLSVPRVDFDRPFHDDIALIERKLVVGAIDGFF